MQQAVQYERAKFQQILDKQPGEKGFHFQHASIWNRTAAVRVIDDQGDFECYIYGRWKFHFSIKLLLTLVSPKHQPAILSFSYIGGGAGQPIPELSFGSHPVFQ